MDNINEKEYMEFLKEKQFDRWLELKNKKLNNLQTEINEAIIKHSEIIIKQHNPDRKPK
jgi:hypothetical protein